MRILRLVGQGHGDANVRVVSIGGEGLCSVEHPVIAVANGGSARAACVGTSFGFGKRPRAQLLAFGQRDKVFALLLFGSKFVDVIGAERIVRGDKQADGTVYTCELFDGGGVFDVAESGAAVLLGENDAHQAHFGQFGKYFRGEMGDFVPLHYMRSDLSLGKFADGLAEVLLFVGKSEIHEGLA